MAILNAPTKSYILRTVDQSNSLMLFGPSESDGFSLIHTAKQYLELISNTNRAQLDALIPEWDGETVAKVRLCLYYLLSVECPLDYNERAAKASCGQRPRN